jgi:hypothetical protein
MTVIKSAFVQDFLKRLAVGLKWQQLRLRVYAEHYGIGWF